MNPASRFLSFVMLVGLPPLSGGAGARVDSPALPSGRLGTVKLVLDRVEPL